MAFETIENCKPIATTDAVPADGVRVTARSLKRRSSNIPTRYIVISIGAGLAKKLVLTGKAVRTALAFGTAKDAGKVRISVDVTNGGFLAKRDKSGRYAISLNAASADGLFSLDFPAFTIPEIEPVHEAHQPPAAIFQASDAMLAVDE